MEGLRQVPLLFQGEECVSAAPPIAEPVLKAEIESLMVDEHDRSTKLEDLNLEDWPLEDSFKLVSDFLDSMPSNAQDTEPERSIWTANPSSVSSSKGFSLHGTSIQTYQKQDHQLEEQRSEDELSILLAQSGLRRVKLLARALAQMQSINADVQVYLRSATINIPNDAEAEPMTPPTQDMGVDTRSLDTTTIGIADALPEYHASDNGFLERNLCSSETKHERISIPPSTSISQGSLSNSHIPGTKSLLTTSKLLPNLLTYSIETPSAKRGLQDFIQFDPPIFNKWLPGGSAKTRPTGHGRGRPPRTDCEHSWQKVQLSLYDGSRRGRPPRPVCVLPWSHRPKGHRRGRPPNNYPSLETDPVSTVFFIGLPNNSYLCMSCCYWMMMSVHSPNHTPLFEGGGGVVNEQFIFLHFCVGHSILSFQPLSSCERRCQTIKVRGVDQGPGSRLRPGKPQWRIFIPPSSSN